MPVAYFQLCTHSVLKQQKLQMMNPSQHDNRQGHQGGDRGVFPRSICTMTNEVKPIKITTNEKTKYESEKLWRTVRNILGDQGNMEQNFWEHGNSVKVNFGEQGNNCKFL